MALPQRAHTAFQAEAVNGKSAAVSVVQIDQQFVRAHCRRRAGVQSARRRPVQCHGTSGDPSPTRRETLLASVATPCGCALCRGRGRSKLRDRAIAFTYSHIIDGYEENLKDRKEKLFAKLVGQKGPKAVLEVGIGPGPNLKYYATQNGGRTVTGLDPNEGMAYYAENTARSLGLQDFSFVPGYAEEMPFKNGSFDAVIATLVLCSVVDQRAALQEIQRVLRPGGKFAFLEHVIGPPGSATRLGQRILDPLQQALADGCHLTRDTLSSIREAGFSDLDAEAFDVEGLGLFAPHITGVAIV